MATGPLAPRGSNSQGFSPPGVIGVPFSPPAQTPGVQAPLPSESRGPISPSEPCSFGQGLTPPPEPRSVPSRPLLLPLCQLHTGPGPEGVQRQTGPEAGHPHGCPWSAMYQTGSHSPRGAQRGAGTSPGQRPGACDSASRGHCQVAPTHRLGPGAMGSGPHSARPSFGVRGCGKV